MQAPSSLRVFLYFFLPAFLFLFSEPSTKKENTSCPRLISKTYRRVSVNSPGTRDASRTKKVPSGVSLSFSVASSLSKHMQKHKTCSEKRLVNNKQKKKSNQEIWNWSGGNFNFTDAAIWTEPMQNKKNSVMTCLQKYDFDTASMARPWNAPSKHFMTVSFFVAKAVCLSRLARPIHHQRTLFQWGDRNRQ